MVDSANKHRGFKKTCLQCRTRKVRCDGRPDFCQNCKRLRFDCSFQRLSDNSTYSRGASTATQMQLEKRRVPTACTACRSLKVRCSGEFPACADCVRRNRHCVYLVLSKASEVPQSSASTGGEAQEPGALRTQSNPEPELVSTRLEAGVSPAEDLLPDSGTVMSLIEAYFDHLYPLPSYAFLHRASLIQRYLAGSLEACLTLTLCAATAQRLRIEPYYPESVSRWSRYAEDDLWHNIESPSIPRLQALLLVIRYLIDDGQFSKAFMISALAARAATALRLYQERPNIHFLAQETRRRLMWSCFLLDGHFSVGLREYEICPPDMIDVQLPCSERAFEDGTPVVTAPLRGVSTNSVALLDLFAASLRLKAIRRDIMRLTRSLKSPSISLFELIHSVQNFEVELQRLHQSLTESDHYSSLMFSQSTEPIRLLMVHLSWHQAYCDLYRIFLPGYREAAPFSILQKLDEQKSMEWQGLCLQHAVAIVHLLSEFSAQCSPPAVDFDIAVCAYHSSRLVLFIAANTFTQRLSRTDALQLARFSQSILSRYFVGYPMADPMMKEIDDTITRCSCEWTGTGTLELQDIEASNEDYEATQGRIRRQLAIHSLIRQANFEGDCHDGTRSEIRRSNVEFQLSTMPQNQSTLTALPAREIATPFGMARVEDSQGAGEIATVEEQSGHIQSESGSEKRTMPNVSTPHENHNREEWRNDMQAVFNPWMGFSESLESYGLALSLEDDYF